MSLPEHPQEDAARTDPAWEREARGAALKLADDVEARFRSLFGQVRGGGSVGKALLQSRVPQSPPSTALPLSALILLGCAPQNTSFLL